MSSHRVELDRKNQNLTSWRLYEDYVSWCKINSQPAEVVSLGEALVDMQVGGEDHVEGNLSRLMGS